MARGTERAAVIVGALAEVGIMELMQRRLGFVGEVYDRGAAGRFARVAKAATSAGAGLLAWRGKRSRRAAAAGGALVLAGELALRWSMFKAGFQSAANPRYTVVPQRERRQDGSSPSAAGAAGPSASSPAPQ